SEKCLQKLHIGRPLRSFDWKSLDTYKSCIRGKMTRNPFNKKGERTSGLLDRISLDVCELLHKQANVFIATSSDSLMIIVGKDIVML
nr:hypothetical protein [Vibrio vulnificus]